MKRLNAHRPPHPPRARAHARTHTEWRGQEKLVKEEHVSLVNAALRIGTRETAGLRAQGANGRARASSSPGPRGETGGSHTCSCLGPLPGQAGRLQALSSWPLLPAPPVLREGAPPKASSTGFLGSRSLHGPRREWWRKVSLTCLEIFRSGM